MSLYFFFLQKKVAKFYQTEFQILNLLSYFW